MLELKGFSGVRAVFFDAVGTVLYPRVSAPQVYAEFAKEYGITIDDVDVKQRFTQAYLVEEAVDAKANWITSEARERERWQRIVDSSLPGTPSECFERLLAHFGTPDAWTVPDGLTEVLEELHCRGMVLGLASNYDSRLKSVLAGRPELTRLQPNVVISSLVGVRKPGADFFAELVRLAQLQPHEILFIGDDIQNDYDGARQYGLNAVLYDVRGKHTNIEHRLASFQELLPANKS